MNRYRRKELDSIIKTLGALYYELEDLSSKETDAYENLPESLQQAQKGEMILEAADRQSNRVLYDFYKGVFYEENYQWSSL